MNITSKALKPFRKSARTPKSIGAGDGWCRELDRAWENGHYAVLARDIQTDWGRVTHFMINTREGVDIPWRDKQIIKNKLAGYEKCAVEVFPAQAELVNDAPAYHLWILHDTKLPFSLYSESQPLD